jgi:hypothetical protein
LYAGQADGGKGRDSHSRVARPVSTSPLRNTALARGEMLLQGCNKLLHRRRCGAYLLYLCSPSPFEGPAGEGGSEMNLAGRLSTGRLVHP